MVILQTVQFQNDKIDVVDNYVSVRKICENIGLIGLSNQYKRIQADESLHSKFMNVIINNVEQKALFIPLNKLNGWLFSINPNKVKPSVKEKLISYKEECFEVLYNHFMPIEAKTQVITKVENTNTLETDLILKSVQSLNQNETRTLLRFLWKIEEISNKLEMLQIADNNLNINVKK